MPSSRRSWEITKPQVGELPTLEPGSMRKRDRAKIAKEIAVENEPRQGRPVSVRPYDEDHKQLDQLANETGQTKAAIVRRMIRFALKNKQGQFTAGQCQTKLDWLVRNGRDCESVHAAVEGNIVEIRDRIEQLEAEVETMLDLVKITTSLTTEIFSMSSMSISSLNLVFTKLIEFCAPDINDRKESVAIATKAMAELIEYAVADLKKCLHFHEHVMGDGMPERIYLGTKIDVLKNRIESLQKL